MGQAESHLGTQNSRIFQLLLVCLLQNIVKSEVEKFMHEIIEIWESVIDVKLLYILVVGFFWFFGGFF